MSTIDAIREPETRELPNKGVSLTLLGLSALVVAAYMPLVVIHGQQLWMRPHYQFFPLILVGAAVLAWRARQE